MSIIFCDEILLLKCAICFGRLRGHLYRFLQRFLHSKYPARRRRHGGSVAPAAAFVIGDGATAVAVALAMTGR